MSRMTISNLKTYRPQILLLIGLALLYEFVPTYRESIALQGDKGGVAQGEVFYKRTYRQRAGKAPSHEVRYTFSVDGQTFMGMEDCQCDALRSVRERDPIEVLYARSDPSINRPAVRRFNGTWLMMGAGAGILFVVAGLVEYIRRRS